MSPIPWEDLADEVTPAGGDASLGGPYPFHIGEGEPSELMETGSTAPSGPSEHRDGSKLQRADEAQLGSGGPAPKHCHLVAPRRVKNFFVPLLRLDFIIG